MKSIVRRIAAVCLLVLLAFRGTSVLGQNLSPWRAYRRSDGLPGVKCTAVSLGAQGRVLAKFLVPSELSVLDGYSISNIPLPAIADGRIHEGPSGQLWTLLTNGPAELKEGEWAVHSLPAEFNSASQTPIDLFPVRQGRVLVLQPAALLQLDAEPARASSVAEIASAEVAGLGRFWGMIASRDGNLWVSAEHGLCKSAVPARNLTASNTWQAFPLPAAFNAHDLLDPRENEDGSLTAVATSITNGEKVILVFDGQNWNSYAAAGLDIRHAWKGPDRILWAMSPTALLRWNTSRVVFTEVTDLFASQYFDLALEPGGDFWLATSAGLFRFSPELWRGSDVSNAAVSSLAADAEGGVWASEATALLHLKGQEQHRYAFPIPRSQIEAAAKNYVLKNGDLLVTIGTRFLQFYRGSDEFQPPKFGNSTLRLKPLGLLKDGSLGLQQIGAAAGEAQYQLFSYDGRELKRFSGPSFETLLGPELDVLFVAHNGEIWLGGERGVAVLRDRNWRSFVSSDKGTPESPLGFTELPDGKIWSATSDSIWEFNGKDWYPLRRGFEAVSSVVRSRDGSLWVSSNNGISRFVHGDWIENGIEDGLPDLAVRAICEDSLGKLWAATARGMSRFHPEADPDPPRASVQNRHDAERALQEGTFLNLSFSGMDKWKFCADSRLLFSFRLDERDWSAFQEIGSASLPDLTAGRHSFQVRALDRNGNLSPKAEQVDFMVMLPWYREKRLVLITTAAFAVIMFFAALAFNRHRTLVRSYAEIELKVAERTRELDLANRQLLHGQKMNALGSLAAGIAHDFNNILSIIKGSTQIIEESLHDPNKIATRLDRIKTVVEQGAGVVKAMLGFSRESETDSGPCDVNVAVQDTIRLLGDRFLREAHVQFHPAPDLPSIRCSRDFVQQIVLNFIFNAAEASSGRKEILVSTGLSTLKHQSLILLAAPAKSCVTISVEDFGCGIPSENLNRIFEPFFTTKALSARRGTGLGLSMVYELAKKMEAGLDVESAPGRGSKFTLFLPIRELNPPVGAERAGAATLAEL